MSKIQKNLLTGDAGSLKFPLLAVNDKCNVSTVSVVNAMLLVGYDERSSHTDVIRSHYVYLLETLDVKFSGLVERLYADRIISAMEKDDIRAEMTSFRANEKFLSALSRKSAEQFQRFLDELDRSGQRHVRDVITDRRQPGLVLMNITVHGSLSAVMHAPFHASVLRPASQTGPMHESAGVGQVS